MATFPANTKVANVSTGLTTDLDTTYGLLQSILGQAVIPSGDTSGATDPGRVAAAIATYGAAVLLSGATYYGSTPVSMGLGQFVYGDASVTWKNVGSGYAFTLANSGAYSTTVSGGIYGGFTIDCSGGAAGVSGIQWGDIVAARIDVQVYHCTGIAAHALNANWFSEWNTVTLRIVNCSRGLVFERTGAGTNSYDRSRYNVYFSQQPAQTGVELGGVAGDVQIFEGTLNLYGNFLAQNTSNSGIMVKFVTANSAISNCELHWGIEVNGTAAQVGPQTVNFGGASNTITNCYGDIRINAFSGTTLQASNNNLNLQDFTGQVTGTDSTLQNLIGGQTAISSGLPAGWTGSVHVQTVVDGIVHIGIALTIANGTVVTNGETILSTLTSPYTPADNKYIACNQTGLTSAVLVAVTFTGHLVYQGAGFTASGTVFLYGEQTYSNSY